MGHWYWGTGASGGDKWLPRPSTFKVLSPIPPYLEGLLVKDLIDVESMSWRVEALHQLFSDVHYICAIPLILRRPEDRLMWHYNKKWLFSFKSAY